MIDNFDLQPYPLECSADGSTWALVVGWTTRGTDKPRIEDRLVPVIALPDGGLMGALDPTTLRYRPADTRPPVVAPRASSSPSVARPSRREPSSDQ